MSFIKFGVDTAENGLSRVWDTYTLSPTPPRIGRMNNYDRQQVPDGDVVKVTAEPLAERRVRLPSKDLVDVLPGHGQKFRPWSSCRGPVPGCIATDRSDQRLLGRQGDELMNPYCIIVHAL